MLDAFRSEIRILAQLARLRMTIFSAVTYSVAFTIGLQKSATENYSMNITQFFMGWAFVLCCQLSAHLLGEYYDLAADKLCKHGSPFTGGSRVLVNGQYSAARCHALGWLCAAIALILLFVLLPSNIHVIGIIMVILSTQYSGAPLRLNHRALGELTAAVIMNVLLPYFSAVLAVSSSTLSAKELHLPPDVLRELAMLIVPSAFVKFALFLVLNMADRESDADAGKVTIPVMFGESVTRRLHVIAMLAGYLGAIVVYAWNPSPSRVSSLLLVLATAIPAISICETLLSYVKKSENRPFQAIALASLKHAPLPLIAIFVDSFAKEIISARSVWHFVSLEFQLRCLPMYPYLSSLVSPAVSYLVSRCK